MEKGTIRKPHANRIRFALAFPNTYVVGMSSLGFQTIYGLINSHQDAVCERVFLPAGNQEVSGQLRTIESDTAVRDFDVLAFSLSFEMDYSNALRIMSMAGIDLIGDDRISDNRQPLVIAGGPAVTFNPEPLANMVDAFIIGEGEDVINEIIDSLLDSTGLDKVDRLERLAHIEGVYVPMFFHPSYKDDGTIDHIASADSVCGEVRRRWVADISTRPAHSFIITPHTQFSNMLLVEIARGCGRQCRFCAAGYTYLPSRACDPQTVMNVIHESGLGTRRVGLVSSSVFDHPESIDICRRLIDEGYSFSISSTRADTLSDDVANLLFMGGHRTITIAPEAGTERLRNVINKAITDRQIINASESAWNSGFRRLKLYFMIGLPTETDEDINAIPSLSAEIAESHSWSQVDVSVSCFVSKPSTPFQWVGMDSEMLLSNKIKILRSAISQYPNIRFHSESPRESVIQGVLARGDRRIDKAIMAYSCGGISWRGAFRSTGIDPTFYSERIRMRNETFPWSHIAIGVRQDFLWNEYCNALEGKITKGCATGVCNNCGVCSNPIE